MKKQTLFVVALAFAGMSAIAQESENFNDENNRNGLISNCWLFSSMDVKTNKSYAINSGSDKPMAQTGQLSGGTHKLGTPFVSFSGSGTLTFNHKLSANNGTTRNLKVYVQDVNGAQVGADLFNWDYKAQGGNMTTVQAASVPYNLSDNYRIIFQWTGSGGNSRGVIDDIVLSSGTFSSDPANNCLPAAGCTDTDNDNVCDDLDDFPNDPNKAYRGAASSETFGFEDLWPATGDFDFNDAVIWWRATPIYDADNNQVSLEWESVTRAVGAGVNNSFALNFYQLVPSDITSVSGNFLTGNFVSNNSNGTEAGQSTAVVFIYESTEDVINRNGGPFYNTQPGAGEGESDTVRVTIEFSSGVSFASFDPFLVVNQTRGREIHRPNWAPTDLADLQLFGTSQDDSDPGSLRYYVTKQNYPWVVSIPNGVTFDYPSEKSDIVTAHLKFATWAQSNGANHSDWYEDKTNYRGASKIFKK